MQGANHATQNQRREVVLFGSLAAVFIAFHAFGYSQILRFNEDIASRQIVQLRNLLTASFIHLVSPLYSAAVYLDQFVPIVGPFSHVVAAAVFAAAMVAFGAALLLVSNRNRVALAVALALVFSSASITEASYWIHALHAALSMALFYATYVCILTFWETEKDRHFIAACTLNFLLFTSSSLAYAPASLLAGFFLLLARGSRRRLTAILISIACIVLFLGYRNYLLTGDVLAFATGYNQAGFRNWQVNAIRMLEHAHPLGLAVRSLPQLYVTYSALSPWAFLHLGVMAAVAGYALHLYGRLLVPLLLYAAGTIVTLLNAGGLGQRHFMTLLVASCFVTALAAVALPKGWRLAALACLGLLATFNFAMKAQTDILTWWKFFGAEREMIAIAKDNDGDSRPFVFLTHEAFMLRNKPIGHWSGGYYATTAGVRRMLADMRVSTCVYKGYLRAEASDSELAELGRHNSAQTTRTYANNRIDNGFDPMRCPERPEGAPRCYEFQAHASARGKYRPYVGPITVPICMDAPATSQACSYVDLTCG